MPCRTQTRPSLTEASQSTLIECLVRASPPRLSWADRVVDRFAHPLEAGHVEGRQDLYTNDVCKLPPAELIPKQVNLADDFNIFCLAELGD